MKLIKKQISLEEGISRNADQTYGLLTATTFGFNIMLEQTIDDMGVFTDFPYVNEPVDYTELIDKLTISGITFPFMSGQTPPSVILTAYTQYIRYDNALVSDWYQDGDVVTAYTESRLNALKSYNKNNRYIINFNIDTDQYLNYDNQTIYGVSRITDRISGDTGTTTYVFDANNDINIGTPNQTSGLLFTESNIILNASKQNKFDFNNKKYTKGESLLINNLSKVNYKAEGWNNTNTSLSALTKEEYLFGIINSPEVFSDVFIDRGSTTVMEYHLKLSEVESIEHLEWYGNGFYNINKK
jgi:hypothetical protein